jgi:hypothetical protein
VFFSGLVLAGQGYRLPSPVIDVATRDWASGYTLQLPHLYEFFAPFCGVADRFTILSYHQAIVALLYCLTALLLFFGLRKGTAAIGLFLLFLGWTILIPHSKARLVADDPNILLIDFHSHTSFSHDGRKWPIAFTPDANRRWHAAQGYNAGFITDHNLNEAAQIAKDHSRQDWTQTGYRSFEGEEVSLYRTHLVILGVHERVDNHPYDSDPARIRPFIADMRKRHIPVIASIPEYWWYHWDGSRIGTYMDFITWGINGFEVINSAPKALDFPPAYQREIIGICRQHNLPITGISDTHGWGSATAAWNAMRIPGWRSMAPDQLEAAVLQALQTQGFGAVAVLERARYNPDRFLQLLQTPFMDAGIYWRSLNGTEVVSWLAWLWIGWILCCGRKNKRTRLR